MVAKHYLLYIMDEVAHYREGIMAEHNKDVSPEEIKRIMHKVDKAVQPPTTPHPQPKRTH
jgi:uncharacterized metal-binding protein